MKYLLLILALFTAFIACKKESNNTTGNKRSKADYHAYLTIQKQTAVRFLDSVTKVDSFSQSADAAIIYNGSALFSGAVSAGGTPLDYNGFTSIYNKLLFSNTTGYPDGLNGGKLWKIEGNTALGIPAFSETSPAKFSSVLLTNFTTVPVIRRDTTYTVTWNTSLPSDSINIVISDGINAVQSNYFAGDTTSYTFTPTQLAILGTTAVDSVNAAVSTGYLEIYGTTYKNVVKDTMPVTLANRAVYHSTAIIR